MDPAALAAYIDGTTSGEERARVESHFADCTECREELASVAALIPVSPRPAWRATRVFIPLAVAAMLLLLLLPRAAVRNDDSAHREPAVVTSRAPGIIEPVGSVTEVSTVAWSRVPGANRYRVTLYDAAGAVLWEETTPDTALAVPAAVTLEQNTPYFWRVHARTGFDRWAESSLVEFRILGPP